MLSLTLVTGWLGSGKTTLLNRILSDDHGMRIAVVQNEFGEIGVDGDLVIGAEFGLYELSNGCLCCAVNDDFLAALEDLAAMENPPDHVLIEASGVADPSATVLSILRHPDHGEAFVLDGVLALADSVNLPDQLGDAPEVAAQIAFADRILLNKIDLAPQPRIDEAERLLRGINPEAEIIPTTNGDADVFDLLDIGGFDLARISLASIGRAAEPAPHDHSAIRAHSILLSEPLDFERFEEWIGRLLRTHGENVYRVKGILRVAGTERTLILQGVRSLYNWRYGDAWKEGEQSRIVFIGRDLDREMLDQGMQRSVAVGAGRFDAS